MHETKLPNCQGIVRVPGHAWAYAIDAASKRRFTKPSDIVREIFDLGLSAHAEREEKAE